MEGGFRLYSEEDVDRVEQIKRLQSLLGLTLAEIKEMVEAEETKIELRATYRPDLDAEARIARLVKAIEVTERQSEIIGAKIDALIEMKADLEAKLQRYRTWIAELRDGLEKEQGGAVYPTR
jgi:DNA-binding transcriptional MerR regulator